MQVEPDILVVSGRAPSPRVTELATLRARVAVQDAEIARLREALRECRRAVSGGRDEPRRNVREIVDEALEIRYAAALEANNG